MAKTKAKATAETKKAYTVEYNVAPILGRTIESVTFPEEGEDDVTLHFTDKSSMTFYITMNFAADAAALGYVPRLRWSVSADGGESEYPTYVNVPIPDAKAAPRKSAAKKKR